MRPLTQLDLDGIAAKGCQDPNCKGCAADEQGIFFMHARCHQYAGVYVSYKKGTGVMTISCCQCERPIAAVAVATFPNE